MMGGACETCQGHCVIMGKKRCPPLLFSKHRRPGHITDQVMDKEEMGGIDRLLLRPDRQNTHTKDDNI